MNKEKSNCILCEVTKKSNQRDDFGQKVLKSFLCENETCLGFTEMRPNAEAHCCVITKAHRNTIRDLTKQE